MISVSKTRLKTRVFEYLDIAERTGEEIIITSNRSPILKIVPILKKKKDAAEVFADLRGKVKYHEDILTPETEFTLPDALLQEIDGMRGKRRSRSAFIVQAITEYLNRSKKKTVKSSDIELINRNADSLNKEANDVLSYQVEI